MLKQQFIEKSKKKLLEKWKRIEKTMTNHMSGRKIWDADTNGLDDEANYLFVDETLENFLDSELSECWDMAGEEVIKTIELDKKVTINLPDPIDAIKFRIEQYGHNQTKTSEVTGISESHLSEILNRKRRLSKNHMIAFMNYGVPAEVLLQHYSLTSKQEDKVIDHVCSWCKQAESRHDSKYCYQRKTEILQQSKQEDKHD